MEAGSIATVRVTTNIGDVRDCRVIRHVDSRDTALGCGTAVPATPEECLRYQVRSVGGDTLLLRGPAGEAYDCGRAESPRPPTPAPAAAAAPTPAAESVSAAPANGRFAALPTPAVVPDSAPSVRATTDRSSAVGCMYLGEVEWTTACGESAGAAVGPCAEKARKLAGNLVVHSGALSEIFWCRPTP
ncbi:MAG TPA: hypothetical protein VFA98_15460 [Thermoanaerobaculia bacterium]|nr:hypothetical protein [Thermoanaerobaculia bacterium]